MPDSNATPAPSRPWLSSFFDRESGTFSGIVSRLLASQNVDVLGPAISDAAGSARLSLTITTEDAEVLPQLEPLETTLVELDEAEAGGSDLAAEAEAHRHTSQSISSVDVRQVSRSVENALPFATLIWFVFLYHNLYNIISIAAGTYVLYRCNAVIARQAARKTKVQHRPLTSCAAALFITALLIAWTGFPGGQLGELLTFRGKPSSLDFWPCMFTAALVDVVLRLCLAAVKACLIATFPIDPQSKSRRRGGLLTAIEYSADVPRTALPAQLWVRYFAAAGIFKLLMVLIVGVYLLFKFAKLLEKTYLAATAIRQWRGVDYGVAPTPEELAAAPGCAICHEDLKEPIRLRCGHQYDEACIAEWLARESTCPMCRSVVRNQEMKPRSDGATSLFPILC